jgi:hypothetical protein
VTAGALSLPRRAGVHTLLGARTSGRAGPPHAGCDDRQAGAGAGARPERTLDDVLLDAWQQLSGHAAVSCPVCRGSMVPRYGSDPAPVGGRCRRCGSTLE